MLFCQILITACLEYAEPYAGDQKSVPVPEKTSLPTWFPDVRYPIEQRIEDKKRGIGRQRYPFLGVFLSVRCMPCAQSQSSLGVEYSHGCSIHIRISCQRACPRFSSFIQGMLLSIIFTISYDEQFYSRSSILCSVHLQVLSSMSGLGFLLA